MVDRFRNESGETKARHANQSHINTSFAPTRDCDNLSNILTDNLIVAIHSQRVLKRCNNASGFCTVLPDAAQLASIIYRVSLAQPVLLLSIRCSDLVAPGISGSLT